MQKGYEEKDEPLSHGRIAKVSAVYGILTSHRR